MHGRSLIAQIPHGLSPSPHVSVPGAVPFRLARVFSAWCCAPPPLLRPPHRVRVPASLPGAVPYHFTEPESTAPRSPWCCVLPTQPPAPSGLSPVPCASLSGATSRSPARSSFPVLIMEQYKNMGVNNFCDHLTKKGHGQSSRHY